MPQAPPAPPHRRATWRGVITCVRAAAMLDAMVGALAAQGHAELAQGVYGTQGSYRPWSKYSANTHAGCGVVDISRFSQATGRLWTRAEWALIVTAARMVGFAAWHRPAIKDLWVEHTHAVACDCPELSQDAKDQVTDYRKGLDGLASHGPDNGPRDWISGPAILTAVTAPIINLEDDMSYVMSTTTATGQGFYLVTPFGRVGLGTLGDVDACLSALNARSVRTMGANGLWDPHTPSPCLQSEADKLDYFEKVARDRYFASVVSNIPTAAPAQGSFDVKVAAAEIAKAVWAPVAGAY